MNCPICGNEQAADTCIFCKIAVGPGGSVFLPHCYCPRCNAARGGGVPVGSVDEEAIRLQVLCEIQTNGKGV